MSDSKLNRTKYLKPFKNIFVIILIVFSIWMLFFDSNSWFIHNELNEDMDKLEEEKEYYQNEIKKDQKEIKELSTDEGIEKYGREHYKMKKEDEEIYIIEYEDSTNQKKN
ncbi:MAG: septum formation initiator family protein [Bacteroidia bacterium]|nr:septum formation initiator family protein [Bacteroidia bacterium]NND26400.1 septum formation initiator [Flavobacteriaceae bacterium]MBT8278198.1 septum formation initiator family protein [Bacteroidia bacterium]NNK58994.1 septum formation initiator [Flavobacteriaceae bacterium]NNL32119.1 septum formation initiator [Flavobacteriaceae bacterium]